ncbi:hypothetical protein AMS68_000719 [Peltaster fructicola]|uniref:polynucleotide adenylyltransferase n=1 Tax=Peltaster fructicola TaxID=286661 RepID=A0A6H0XKE4_9PEZI|nr:hypothetical protein AMS68_000719 [Peltaster fructicola]
MGDSYRPARGSSRDRQPRRGFHYYDRDRDRTTYPGDSEHDYRRQPPPRYPSPPNQTHEPRRDHYEPRRKDHESGGYGSLAYGGRASDFKFKGASQHNSSAARPEEHFTFAANGPPAPSFPPESHYAGRDGSRPRGGKSTSGRGRNSKHNNDRPYQRRRPKPAHERDLLNRDRRSSTPEQLEGMNIDAQPRFKDIDDMSDSSESDSDGPQAKRAKLAASADRPKWSNPDPYTALPPPDAISGPKRDIVQVIRKAKAEQLKDDAVNSAVKKNEDFISFDVSDSEPPSPRRYDDDRVSVESGEISGGVSLREHYGYPKQPKRSLESRIDAPPSFAAKHSRDSSDRSHGHVDRPDSYMAAAGTHKRKRHDTLLDTGILADWQPQAGRNPTPWYRANEAIFEPGSRLHQEINDFYNYVQPLEQEEVVRLDLVRRISDTVQMWGDSRGQRDLEVHVFGSFASGLYLPDADMDIVVLSKSFRRDGKPVIGVGGGSSMSPRSLGSQLQRAGIVRPGTLVCIMGARVPLIKFVDALTGIKVDISFENASGLVAISTFDEWKEKYPAMPVLVVLIKQLLAMHGQNEVHSGGIGGFSIICLVVSMLQHQSKIVTKVVTKTMEPPAEPAKLEYSDLLMRFLELYGVRFDYRSTGIIMEPPEYYDKQNDARVHAQDDRLTIVDPNNPSNDISGGSRNIAEVFSIFSHAHARIQQLLADLYQGRKPAGSILGCCWAANYASFDRQRKTLLSVYDAVMDEGSPPGLLKVPAFNDKHFQPRPRQKKAATGHRRRAPSPRRHASRKHVPWQER